MPDPTLYRIMRAELMFRTVDRTEGIADMEAIVEGADPSEQTRRAAVMLARMLLETGNKVGARRLVEEVLTADPGQVDALRMSAGWQIEADDTDGAIATLRQALDQAPQDVAAMTLMSRAYLRAGNRDLAREFLSLAVDALQQCPLPKRCAMPAFCPARAAMPPPNRCWSPRCGPIATIPGC